MWFKRGNEEAKQQEYQAKERKLFKEICDSLTAIEHRISSIEIEIDALKLRWKKKLVEPAEEKQTFNNDGTMYI
jgi:hypothetical protein